MKRNRQLEIGVALALAFVLVACGSARQKTIRITYEAANIAADQLPQFTETHGKAIIDAAKAKGETREQASAEVEAFLSKAKHADLTLRAVYRMVAAAAVLDDDRSLAALLEVARMLQAELKELGLAPTVGGAK